MQQIGHQAAHVTGAGAEDINRRDNPSGYKCLCFLGGSTDATCIQWRWETVSELDNSHGGNVAGRRIAHIRTGSLVANQMPDLQTPEVWGDSQTRAGGATNTTALMSSTP